MKREIRKYFEQNENKYKKCKNLWDAAREVFKGKLTLIEISQINDLHFHFKS